MKAVTEDELIAYHLGELSSWRRAMLKRRLEHDAELASQSEEVAATLRLFACDEPMTATDAAAERAWAQVRPSLAVLDGARPAGKQKFWLGAAAGALATALAVAILTVHLLRVTPVPSSSPVQQASVKQSWSQSLLQELHTRKPPGRQFNQRPGPLTVAPVDVVADNPQLAAHLDTAERVLTEVSHTEGTLPDETRTQVRRLLLENAMYHQAAETHGDLATAAVIDDLGRVLISLDAEPKQAAPDTLRVQMNIGGVLLDLRILHHSDGPGRSQ